MSEPGTAERGETDRRHPTPTNATRYLCAAAYRDRSLADWVIENVLEEEHRGHAPSYGIDTVLIARHCLRARRRRLQLNVILTGLLLLGPVVALALQLSAQEAAVRVLLLAWAAVFVAGCLDRYEIVGALFLRDRFTGAAPPVPEHMRRRLNELSWTDRTNVTVYSGFSPFVGSGVSAGGWSFVVDTRKGKQDVHGARPPQAFRIDEIYSYTADKLHELRIDRLRTENRLFVNGREVRGLSWLLPDEFGRPRYWVDPSIVWRFLHAPSERVRHYLAVQLVEWDGELVLTIFLRFSQTGANLFCEASYYLLPPIAEKYHSIDDLNGSPDLGAVAQLMAAALVRAPFQLVCAPFLLYARAHRVIAGSMAEASRQRFIRKTPTFDYGATTTLREHVRSTRYRHYFQKLDGEMYVKLTEQQIFESIISFLDQHDIDTGDLKERQTTVLNHGVIMSGGTIQAGSVAVGSGATARSRSTGSN